MAEPVYRPVIVLVRSFFAILGLRLDVRGLEHLPRRGGVVLAINHISYLDFALAGRAILPTKRLVRFLAKKSIFDVPVVGFLMRNMGHISVDRKAGGDAYRNAINALERGEIVGVFPESTISPDFELAPFKSGATRMALASGTPLVPMAIWGAQRVWTKGHRPVLSRKRIPIAIEIGAPISGTDPDEILFALRQEMERLLTVAQARYPDSPAGQWWASPRLGGTARGRSSDR